MGFLGYQARALFIIFSFFVFYSLTVPVKAIDTDSWLQDFTPNIQQKVIYKKVPFRRRKEGYNSIKAKVDLSSQKMRVYINGSFWQEWPVSSGAKDYETPTGRYRPTRLHREWYSRQYFYSPMPHSVFFHRGYAIHGTNYISKLGRAVSHGCVRLHPKHAAVFFDLVEEFGIHKTKIIVQK